MARMAVRPFSSASFSNLAALICIKEDSAACIRATARDSASGFGAWRKSRLPLLISVRHWPLSRKNFTTPRPLGRFGRFAMKISPWITRAGEYSSAGLHL